jgi:hypothetical protein
MSVIHEFNFLGRIPKYTKFVTDPYLVLKAKEKYNPNRKVPFEAWAYYYARMKLRDHFWRGNNLPGTKGTFTLLHIKARQLHE